MLHIEKNGRSLSIDFSSDLTLVGFWSATQSTNALMHEAYNELEAVREIKKGQIEKYFAEREGDISVLMETVGTLRKEAFNKLEAIKEIKKTQIESYFSDRLRLMTTWTPNTTA